MKTLAARDGRITYEGGAQDLEANHRLSAPDWAKFSKIGWPSILLPFMSHPVRRILHYRQLDYPWKQIGQRLALPRNRLSCGSTMAYAKHTRNCY